MHKIKDMLMRELKKYEEKGELSAGSLEVIHKLTDTIKNIDKIEMLEDSGYSEADDMGYGGMSRRGSSYEGGSRYGRRGYSREDNYEGGGSYANRGKHYVRGHYSRDDGREYMMEQLEEMMDTAGDAKERDAIRRCMDELKKM